jgi:hypothetical protein
MPHHAGRSAASPQGARARAKQSITFVLFHQKSGCDAWTSERAPRTGGLDFSALMMLAAPRRESVEPRREGARQTALPFTKIRGF